MADDALDASAFGLVPANPPASAAASGQSAFPVVAPHHVPGSSDPTAMTNLSDTDYAKFVAGQSPPPAGDHPQTGESKGGGGKQSLNAGDFGLIPATSAPASTPPAAESLGLAQAPLPGGPQQISGVMREPAIVGSGLVQGAAGLLGFPGDVTRGITALGGAQAAGELQGNPLPAAPTFDEPGKFSAFSVLTPQALAAAPGKQQITSPTGHNPIDTETLTGLTNAMGLTNRPDLQPQGLGENLLSGASKGVGMVAPTMLTGGVSTVPAALRLLRTGAAMGVGGEGGGMVGQAVGGTPGALIGGALGSVAPSLGAAAIMRGARAVGPMIQNALPVTQGAREAVAARSFAPANTPEVRAALAAPKELVPNSPVTSYQATGNPFLGAQERGIANRVQYKPAFDEVRQAQNAARVASIKGQAPKDADVGGIIPWFRGRLERMRAEEGMDTGEQRAVTQNAVDAMGNPIAPHEAGATVRGAVEGARAPVVADSDRAIEGAQRRAETATSGIGGEPAEHAVQQHGGRMRGERVEGAGLLGHRSVARKQADELYEAVDPDHKLVVGNLDPVAETASLLRGDDVPRKGWKLDADQSEHLSDFAAAGRHDLAPAEAKVLDFAAGLRNADTFQNLRRLERMAAAAQRSIRANATLGVESLPYRRMTELRNAMDNALSHAAGEAASGDGRIAERLASMAEEEHGPVVGESGGPRDAGSPSGGEAGVSGPSGTESEGTGRPGDASGAGPMAAETSVLPSDLTDLERGIYSDLAPKPAPVVPKLVPNLTDADTEALRRANANYADYKAKYTKGAVGDVLLPSGRTLSGFKTENSGVPATLFAKGPKGAEAADSLIAATGSPDAALHVLGDYPAYSLRQAAEEMGTLNVKKYDAWMTAHQAVMDKFPELKASFDTAAKARAVLDDLKSQRAAIDAANPIKPGWGDAEVMQRFVQPGPKGYEAAENLVKATGDSPTAKAATRDYLASSLREAAEIKSGPNAGTLDLGAYQRWLKQYGSFLSHPSMADVRQSFGEAGVAQAELDAAAAAHQRAQRAYETSVARHFLPDDTDPVSAIGKILGSGNPGAQMADLARQTASDPKARESIQAAVIRYMLRRLESNNPVGTSLEETYLKANESQNFIRQHVGTDGEGALRQIMTPEQLEALNNVALDMRRSNLSISGNKNPGGSDTGLITSAREADEHAASPATMFGLMEVAGDVGEKVLDTKWGRVVGAIGVPLLNLARKAGFHTVNDLRAEALLHPDKLSALLARLPTTESKMSSRFTAIKGQLAALSAVSGTRAANENSQQTLQPALTSR